MEIKINLIPPYKRHEIERNEKLKSVYRFGFLIVLVGAAFYWSLWSFNYILDLNLKAVSKELDSSADRAQFEKIKKLDGQFVEISKKLDEVESIRKDQLYWSRFLVKLNEDTISGIKITSMGTKNYQVSMVGVAKDRDILIAFKDKLTQEPCFSSVNLPLSNLSLKKDIVFQISFAIKESCIKNQ